VIRKSGAFYSYDGEQLGQGREKARLALCEQPDLADAIEDALRCRIRAGTITGARIASGPIVLDTDDPLDS
jgi:recombination protein RecA